MDSIRRLLTFFLVLMCGIFTMIWAGYYNDGLDFVGLGVYALDIPPDPFTGPLGVALGSLLLAYFIYPAEKKR